MVCSDEESPFIDNHPTTNGRFSSIAISSLSDLSGCDNTRTAMFLELPAKQKKVKRKKKKQDKEWRSKKGSCKTIDSIPASIPEENSEDLISSDPDIETVEYVRRAETEYNNENTVHSVHQIFAEMDELVQEEGEDVWEEKARWIKFEQDIYRGADKWSKPHVATLKLHSIIALRKCISHGTVLLGMNAFNLESVIEMTLDRLVSRALISSDVAGMLRTLLLKRHVHTGEHQDMRKFRRKSKLSFLTRISEGLSPAPSPPDSRINSRTNSEQDLIKLKQQFLRKLPADTEASNVMIGQLDYLHVPVCVTIRLSHSILLGDITEVPIPTRFIFLLLCPLNSHIDHVEVGRAASTLFADEMFYKAAYSATSKAHVIQGIDRFLEKAIVIPPGEWNPKMKITMPEEEGAEESGKEEDEKEIEETDRHHRYPLGGIRHDMMCLSARYRKEWRRGLHHLIPLISPIQYSLISLSYILFLLVLARLYILVDPFYWLLCVGIVGVVTAVGFCQPLVMCCVSFPVVMWECGVARVCGMLEVEYHLVRPFVGLITGLLLVLCSVLNVGHSHITMFVYECVFVAMSLSVVVVLVLHTISLAQMDSASYPLFLVIILATLILLKAWHGLTTSTILTNKIRSTIRIFDGVIVFVLAALLLYLFPLTTPSYINNPTEHQPQNTLLLPGHLLEITIIISAGTLLAILVYLQYGVVFNWIIQPRHKLKRSHGRYLDQSLVGVGVIISALCHLPFLVPDPLLTSVFVQMISVTSKDTRDVLFIREQRVTQFLSGLLVLSALPGVVLGSLHQYMPLPVCWGVVVFYSGICLADTQLYERTKILHQAEKYHPETNYLQNTPQNVVTSYTIVQIVIVVGVVVVLSAPLVPTFLPLLLVFVILLRKYLLPIVMFENLIVLLEGKMGPASPVPEACVSSTSLTVDNVEFSEEMSRISNGNFNADTADQLFPQIIFDNLTDDDHFRMSDVRTQESSLDNVSHQDSDGTDHTKDCNKVSSLDFLADPATCPLPFELDSEEPVKSENPFNIRHSTTYLDCEPASN